MASKCAVQCAMYFFIAVLVTGIILLLIATAPSRNYDVSIDSVSGLDLPLSSSKDLNLQFNLTLRFISTNPFRHECMDADTDLLVSYRCNLLATATITASDRLCVGPKKSTEGRFVAKGTGVHLPGPLMDSLAADMRSGVEAFDVRIIGRGFWMASCRARRFGDGSSSCIGGLDVCAPPRDTTSDAVLFYTPVSIPTED